MPVHISQTNPNQDAGGTGCLYAGESKDFDCKGLHAVFPAVRVVSGISPHASICEYHLGVAFEEMCAAGTSPADVPSLSVSQPEKPKRSRRSFADDDGPTI